MMLLPSAPLLLYLIITIVFLSFPVSAYSDSNLKINEFLAHPTSGNKEWVEFYNPDSVDLSSYYLDDDTDFASDSGSSSKKSLSTLDSSNPLYPFLEFSSFLNNSGDWVVLFNTAGTIIDQYQYADDPGVDVSIGRSPDGTGDLAELSIPTKGAANSSSLPSPSPSPSPSPKPPSPTTTNPSKSSSISKSPSPQSSPQGQTAKTQQATVLGEKESTPTATPSAPPRPTATPTPVPQSGTGKTKIAAALAGSGLFLIGLAIVAYLWYAKKFH